VSTTVIEPAKPLFDAFSLNLTAIGKRFVDQPLPTLWIAGNHASTRDAKFLGEVAKILPVVEKSRLQRIFVEHGLKKFLGAFREKALRPPLSKLPVGPNWDLHNFGAVLVGQDV
jgi:hypothetical protein